jgi:group I intron endonuclease
LREVAKLLRDSEPLNKVIWKVYYENAYTDMVGRILGKQAHTGIYKITNLTNGMCYVGQAANVADRWKQHIKRGIGADPPTRNKLYPAMLAIGVENFSFELIEECSRDELNEKEQFWQEYFKAKEFGYSIK